MWQKNAAKKRAFVLQHFFQFMPVRSNRAMLTGCSLYHQVIMAFLILAAWKLRLRGCQDEACSITYSAIWPQEVIAGAKVMVNFIRLPRDPSGTQFALFPLQVVILPTHPPFVVSRCPATPQHSLQRYAGATTNLLVNGSIFQTSEFSNQFALCR